MGVYKHLSVNMRVNECMKYVVTFRFVYLKIIIACVRVCITYVEIITFCEEIRKCFTVINSLFMFMSMYVGNNFNKSKYYKEIKINNKETLFLLL